MTAVVVEDMATLQLHEGKEGGRESEERGREREARGITEERRGGS